MFNPNLFPSNNPRRNNRNGNNSRPQNIIEQVRDMVFNQNPIMLIFMAMSLLTLLAQAMPYVLAGVYTCLVSFSILLWTTLDFSTGSRLGGEVPALMWMLWGAVFGACGAFWLSAPLYGWRKKRSLILLAPLLLMLVVGAVISVSNPLPKQSNLLEGVSTPTAPTPNVPLP